MLTAIILVPLAGALLCLAVGRQNVRAVKHIALATVALDFLLSLLVLVDFQWGQIPQSVRLFSGTMETLSPFQFREHATWLADWGISYTVGVDSLSLLLMLLATFLGIIGVLCSYSAITERQPLYYFFLLMLQTGILGTFLALDLFLFYIFWELMLIPLYFLIGIWGSKDRVYATMKFVLYTLAGSVLMLLGILYVYAQARAQGFNTFSYEILAFSPDLGGRSLLPAHLQFWPFLAFFLAFAIKVPMFPFHTWLPDAHTEAPTAGSVILAGTLLKTGVYGILRFCIPLFPDMAVSFAPLITWMAVVAIIFGAFAALAQHDMKRLVAYSSVSHMGFMILGIFTFTAQGMSGAILQMVNHGISTGGLFLAVGIIYERRHTREMAQFGGLAKTLPVYAALTMVMVLSSVGLPGLNGFVGEFLILLGSMHSHAFLPLPRVFPLTQFTLLVAALAGLGLIFGAVYLLVMYQKVFYGKVTNPENRRLPDLNPRELLQLVALTLLAVWIGLYPRPFLRMCEEASAPLLTRVSLRLPSELAPTSGMASCETVFGVEGRIVSAPAQTLQDSLK